MKAGVLGGLSQKSRVAGSIEPQATEAAFLGKNWEIVRPQGQNQGRG